MAKNGDKLIILIILIILIFLLCGCENQKCINSHQELSRCVQYSYVKAGNVNVLIPHYYDCLKTICDEYEVTKELKR